MVQPFLTEWAGLADALFETQVRFLSLFPTGLLPTAVTAEFREMLFSLKLYWQTWLGTWLCNPSQP